MYRVAIVGRPNVGKSSLFNALVGYERALVSEYKGTTRDFIEEKFSINGVPIKLIDTAGIRESEDFVERLGIEKSKEKIEEADIVIFVFDASQGLTEEDLKIYNEIKHKNPIIVGNKIDIAKNEKSYYFKDIIFTSVKSQEGISKLEEEISKRISFIDNVDTDIYINLRHKEALEKALNILENLNKNLFFYENQKEILMLEIREAEKYLEEIIGVIATEDILGNIFSSFCIGK